MSTTGTLVFGGSSEGNFFARDAETDKYLWQLPTDGHIHANPVPFAVDGQQQITIAAGNPLLVFGLLLE